MSQGRREKRRIRRKAFSCKGRKNVPFFPSSFWSFLDLLDDSLSAAAAFSTRVDSKGKELTNVSLLFNACYFVKKNVASSFLSASSLRRKKETKNVWFPSASAFFYLMFLGVFPAFLFLHLISCLWRLLLLLLLTSFLHRCLTKHSSRRSELYYHRRRRMKWMIPRVQAELSSKHHLKCALPPLACLLNVLCCTSKYIT